ncbi:MAG TPA: type II secretion system protein [Candidatus Wallbacteria bacterium]|nr:type II secretion system protein [Candidatus Wallbacteria bacterium]
MNEKLKKNNSCGAKVGFTLIEMMIVIAVIGILMSMGFGYYQRAKAQALIKTCKKNMFTLEGAITQHSLNTNNENYSETISDSFINELVSSGYLKDPVKCPFGGTLKLENSSSNNIKERTIRCSIHGTRHEP